MITKKPKTEPPDPRTGTACEAGCADETAGRVEIRDWVHTVTFEGNGHTLYKMKKYEEPSSGNSTKSVGLFGSFVGAENVNSTLNIEKITLDQANFTAVGSGVVGAFIGDMQLDSATNDNQSFTYSGYNSINVHIKNCHVTNSNLTDQNGVAGGIACNGDGVLNAFTMENCSVTATNIVARHAGGLLGNVSTRGNDDASALVVDSCSLSSVNITSRTSSAAWDANNCYAGQLVAYINQQTTVKVTETSTESVSLHLENDSGPVEPGPDTDTERKVGYLVSNAENPGHLLIDGDEYSLPQQ